MEFLLYSLARIYPLWVPGPLDPYSSGMWERDCKFSKQITWQVQEWEIQPSEDTAQSNGHQFPMESAPWSTECWHLSYTFQRLFYQLIKPADSRWCEIEPIYPSLPKTRLPLLQTRFLSPVQYYAPLYQPHRGTLPEPLQIGKITHTWIMSIPIKINYCPFQKGRVL